MLRIPYQATNFGHHWGSALAGNKTLEITWEEVVWSAITMGKPGATFLFGHGWHSASDLVVRAHTVFANLQQTSWYLTKSSLYNSLDPTEKGATSYFIGMMAAKIVGLRLLDTPWLFHLSMLVDLGGKPILVGKSQPDLIGINGRRDWIVAEAKGRTEGYSARTMISAKKQTKKLRRINGDFPALRIAVQSFFATSLTFALEDPEEFEKDAKDLTFDENDAFKKYYDFTRMIPRDKGAIRTALGRVFYFHALGDSGISVGIVREVAEISASTVSFRDVTKALGDLTPGRDEEKGISVFTDGIAVALDERWSSTQMQKDPRSRQPG